MFRIHGKSMAWLFALFLVLATVSSAPLGAEVPEDENTLYVVGVSHLDTQWWWTIQKTIIDYLPGTFEDTYDLFEKYPDFVFSWEGSFRYQLLEEYYPELYIELLDYVQAGRWYPGGSSVEPGDVNTPSPESLIRQFLYGNAYFKETFGKTSIDVFLPDCFGFGYALPSIAAHCGLKGFSTQKLSWGVFIDRPFEIGVWEGPDGNSLISAINPGSYTSKINHDLSYDASILAKIEKMGNDFGVPVAYHYFGVGDFGGSVPAGSVNWLQTSIDSDGPVRVLSTTSDQLFRDLSEEQVARLPRYKGELLLTTHSTGSYTSQAAMKRYNRKNELLANAAEGASVAAHWLGLADYPRAKLKDAWIRFLSRQFHDDLTGTGIPEIYVFSWNDEFIAHNRFASTLTTALGAVASGLDTSAEGHPLVVYNPLAIDREDVVEATVRFSGPVPEHLKVYSPNGVEVPSQVLTVHDQAVQLAFLASVPSLGFTVFDVRPADNDSEVFSELSVEDSVLENNRYRVEIDPNGDISAVYDKQLERDLLDGPIRLALFEDTSAQWPAWEIAYEDLLTGVREHVEGPAEVTIMERGPARAAIEIRRSLGDSTFVQTIRLTAGGGRDRVEIEARIDWWTQSSLLKLVFPLSAGNPEATYDLGLGTITRGNNTDRLYEVPAQQWADITDQNEDFGVSILNDCKYGWDKPDDHLLRLTLLHLPMPFVFSMFYGQDQMDIGEHRLLYGLYGHASDWREGTAWQAARLNQPMMAFQTRAHEGPLASSFSFLQLNRSEVMIKAVKLAEDSDEIIIRVQETTGLPVENVKISIGAGLVSAREVNGSEEEVASLTVTEGDLAFDMKPYEIRSFALAPAVDPSAQEPLISRPIELPYNLDVVSFNDDPSDGAFDTEKGLSYPGETFPEELINDGIRYELGPIDSGAFNALACRGQAIPIEAVEGDRLYILAAALGEQEASFKIGDLSHSLSIGDFAEAIGQWNIRVIEDEVLRDLEDFLPGYLKQDELGWYATHRHTAEGDDPYKFLYLFQYILPIPAGATEFILPEDENIRIFAASLADNPNHDLVPASELYDGFDPLQARPDWQADLLADVPDGDGENGDGDKLIADGDEESVSPPDGDSAVDGDDSQAEDDSGGGCRSSAPFSTCLMALAFLLLICKRRMNAC